MDAAQERAMFGCTLEEFRKSVHLYDLEKPGDALMVSMSLQSDAQELLAMGEREQARQRLNLSKYLVGEVRAKIEDEVLLSAGVDKALEEMERIGWPCRLVELPSKYDELSRLCGALLEATSNESEFTSGRLDTPTWSAVAALRKALVADPENDWSRGAK